MSDDRTIRVDGAIELSERWPASGPPEPASLASQLRFLETILSSIPDFVYAFDPRKRFAYANPATLALFGLAADEMVGKSLADLDFPVDLADQLNGLIDRVVTDGVTVEDEVFYQAPNGYAAWFDFLWGPVRGPDGAVELVVGVSRDTSERRSFEEELRKNEARLRSATELVGIGIYSWDPASGGLEWDDRLRRMWGLSPGEKVDMKVFEAGIHADDLPRVKRAIAACADPDGDGRYAMEYRVIGRDDGVIRHIATSGLTTFSHGQAQGFIGAAIDVSDQRRNEAAVRANEALFRSFADNSSNLIWIGDPLAGTIIYRSAAYEKIWGAPLPAGSISFARWLKDVHGDDRTQVEHALETVLGGEVAQLEYRIVRPLDGTVRSLRETCFPIMDGHGAVSRIGGITEDLTQDDVRQAYVVCGAPAEGRRLVTILRSEGYRARTFVKGAAFLDVAPVLAHGCVLVDLRRAREDGLSVPRELKARSISLPTIAIGAPGTDVTAAVSAMKAGAVDYLVLGDEAAFRSSLATAMAECLAAARPATVDDVASARVARLTPREREVLLGLVEGGTNKSIGKKLGISPRTVELHRAQVMSRLNANTLTELLQIALSAGIAP